MSFARIATAWRPGDRDAGLGRLRMTLNERAGGSSGPRGLDAPKSFPPARLSGSPGSKKLTSATPSPTSNSVPQTRSKPSTSRTDRYDVFLVNNGPFARSGRKAKSLRMIKGPSDANTAPTSRSRSGLELRGSVQVSERQGAASCDPDRRNAPRGNGVCVSRPRSDPAQNCAAAGATLEPIRECSSSTRSRRRTPKGVVIEKGISQQERTAAHV